MTASRGRLGGRRNVRNDTTDYGLSGHSQVPGKSGAIARIPITTACAPGAIGHNRQDVRADCAGSASRAPKAFSDEDGEIHLRARHYRAKLAIAASAIEQ